MHSDFNIEVSLCALLEHLRWIISEIECMRYHVSHSRVLHTSQV